MTRTGWVSGEIVGDGEGFWEIELVMGNPVEGWTGKGGGEERRLERMAR